MVEVENIYYNIGEDYNPTDFKKEILEAYSKYDKIRLIFDLEGKKINIKSMSKLKKIFEEIGVEKLEETCIIARDGFKKTLIKNFLKIVKTKKPVNFI